MTLQLTPDGTTCWINYVNGSEYPELTEPSELFSLALQSSSRFAPWRSWERLIRSVRKILNVTVKEQLLDEGLHTLLCEAETIINSRPITKPSSVLNDLKALTPNHLLLLKVKPELPPGVFNKDNQYVNRRWRQVQYLSDVFWKRWCKEYLTQLQERQLWSTPGRNFCVGDVVLIVDDTSPKNSWPLGRILEIRD